MALGPQLLDRQCFSGHEAGKPHLPVLQLCLGVVRTFDISPQKTREIDHPAICSELCVLASRTVRPEARLDGEALGVGHLRSDGAGPYEVVKAQLVARKPAALGVAELVAGRADSLVGLLSVFHPLVVKARACREVGVPIELADQAQELLGQVDGAAVRASFESVVESVRM